MAWFDRRADDEPRRKAALPELEAQPGGVARHVGSVLVDDPDDAERRPHPSDPQAVGPDRPSVTTSPTGSGERGHLSQPGGHGLDAVLGQAQPVDRPRAQCPRPRPRARSARLASRSDGPWPREQVGGQAQGLGPDSGVRATPRPSPPRRRGPPVREGPASPQLESYQGSADVRHGRSEDHVVSVDHDVAGAVRRARPPGPLPRCAATRPLAKTRRRARRSRPRRRPRTAPSTPTMPWARSDGPRPAARRARPGRRSSRPRRRQGEGDPELAGAEAGLARPEHGPDAGLARRDPRPGSRAPRLRRSRPRRPTRWRS